MYIQSCEEVSVALALCHCWSVVLTARLQSESQRELRKWHTKVNTQRTHTAHSLPYIIIAGSFCEFAKINILQGTLVEIEKSSLQILLQCGSLVVQHRGVAPVIISSLNLTTRLVALPTKVRPCNLSTSH